MRNNSPIKSGVSVDFVNSGVSVKSGVSIKSGVSVRVV